MGDNVFTINKYISQGTFPMFDNKLSGDLGHVYLVSQTNKTFNYFFLF